MGKIFDIQRFCTDDGPGIRTTVFLKGCPLRCLWCHNPESQRMENEIMFTRDKCTGCGRCAKLSADDTAFVCYSDAKKICGRETSAQEVLDEVMKDSVFYRNSGGGLTLSGGEPLFQPGFAVEILRGAKENGLHTCVETCGFASAEHMVHAAAYTDLFLYDYKETDPEKHRRFTGADSKRILENLGLLEKLGKPVILRCPVIPGYNDQEAHYTGICALADRHKNILHIEIEPGHDLGVGKYAALGREAAPIAPLSREDAEIIVERIRRRTGCPVKLA